MEFLQHIDVLILTYNEERNLGEEACAPLPDLARSLFHVMPNLNPPGRPPSEWGKKK